MVYTYDRVILGSLCSILALTCLILLFLHFYRKYNPWSFHPWFLFLSFCWMLLRSLFWFIPIEACSTFFLYYIPISIQFFVFGLLLVWIVFMIYDATRKYKYVYFFSLLLYKVYLNGSDTVIHFISGKCKL
jgi:hypothetical protein